MTEDWRFFIGNQTAFCALPSAPFGFAVEHHFEAFEFFPDGGPNGRGWAADDVTPDERRGFRLLAHEKSIRLSVHAALEAKLLDSNTWGGLMHDIDLARDLGAKVLNLHLGSGDTDGCARGALALVEILKPMGIALALENTVSVSPDEVNDVFRRVQQTETDEQHSVGLCLDIGHANLYAGTRNDYLRYLDGLGSHVPIVHAHIHENWGDSDSHLTLFTGPSGRNSTGVAGLLRRLRQRRFKGSMILEQWPTPASLLTVAHDRLRTM
jgi:sugar phosphate isomerase/epimerase